MVPYCTGDSHRGNNTVASAKTWGFIFDGHASFAAVVEELIRTRGLGDAKRVLLTGSSAGGIGCLQNLDWLAARLPRADVKGAPTAGWFFPAALAGDLPDVYPPSDFAHFAAGTHGNAETAAGAGSSFLDLIDGRGLLSADCVAAQKPGEEWACSSAHTAYPYIKTPLYVIENMYDTAQIYAADGHLPKHPTKSEAAAVDRYVGMYGQAMRNSTAQVLLEPAAGKPKKRVADGLFLPACFQHPIDFAEQITAAGASGSAAGPQSWQLLLGDWFFERNQFQQFHRLVEHCPTDLPCNTAAACKYAGSGPPGPAPGGSCSAQLVKDGCLASAGQEACDSCARKHESDLQAAGCTRKLLNQLCAGGGPSPAPPGGSCSAQLAKDGCSASAGQEACEACAEKHQSDLKAAGCTPKLVNQLCAGGGPAPAPAANCSSAEKQYCPGLAGGGAGKGDPCFACVVKFEDQLIAAGCFASTGSGKRHAFIEAFCK